MAPFRYLAIKCLNNVSSGALFRKCAFHPSDSIIRQPSVKGTDSQLILWDKHMEVCCVSGPETPHHCTFFFLLQTWRTLFLQVMSWSCSVAIREKVWKKKNSSGRGRGRKAARGKRKRRPLVLEGVGLSLVREVNGSSCPAWPTLMKLQISRLHESSHSPFSSSSSSSCSAPTWTSFHKEGIPPLRPLSSALRQSDCWTRGGRWDILN